MSVPDLGRAELSVGCSSISDMATSATREQVLSYRVRAHQLDRAPGNRDAMLFDAGVQDTGPDGALWALEARGVDTCALSDDELVLLWTLRGAPHLYRRSDVSAIAAAVRPFSDADAAKRIFDASKPLKAAGIGAIEALDAVAAAMRSIVREPMVKGEVSTQLTQLMDEPYLRWCRSCQATHLYEQTFRLAALYAGLELQPGTSPPVMRPIPELAASGRHGRAAALGPSPEFRMAGQVSERFDVVRAYLALNGPAIPAHVAAFLDAPVKDVKSRWPEDLVEVDVNGERRWMLRDRVAELDAGRARTARLLGPYDAFLQVRDRPLLVPDPARQKELWPVLGRPGAVVVDGEIVGTWRPRTSGKKLRLQLQLWQAVSPENRIELDEQAGRLAAFRGVELAGVDVDE